MNRTRTLAALVALGVPTAPVVAQSAPLEAAVQRTLEAWGSGNFETLALEYLPDTRGYLFDGGARIDGAPTGALAAAHAAGLRIQLTVRDLDVRVYGDAAAVVGIVEGTITLPGGAPVQGPWRYSETRVRDGERWRIAQYHMSPMTQPAPRRGGGSATPRGSPGP